MHSARSTPMFLLINTPCRFLQVPITDRPRYRPLRVCNCMSRHHCHPPLSHRLSTHSCCSCHCSPPHPSLPPRAALPASLLAYFWRQAAGGRPAHLPLALPRSLHEALTTTRPAFLLYPPQYPARPPPAAKPHLQPPTFVPAAPALSVPTQRPHPRASGNTAEPPLPSLSAHGRPHPQTSAAFRVFWALSSRGLCGCSRLLTASFPRAHTLYPLKPSPMTRTSMKSITRAAWTGRPVLPLPASFARVDPPHPAAATIRLCYCIVCFTACQKSSIVPASFVFCVAALSP